MISSQGLAVKVKTGRITLDGDLALPADARAIVLFAHGSGSSRLSPRNRYVAEVLRASELGTLLFDLLTPDEEAEDTQNAAFRFDIELLARRLIGATQWLMEQEPTRNLKPGYFGASTGAAAALRAAAALPHLLKAVVSRGGRPDLAGEALEHVLAPTLLIVGGQDYPVIDINRTAFEVLKADKKLVIIPGATHLFEEPGALEEVARLATDWFSKYAK